MELMALTQTKKVPVEVVKTVKMLTPKDIAEIFGISYESALAFVKNSGIDYIRVGRQYRVSEDKLKRFISRGGSVSVDLI